MTAMTIQGVLVPLSGDITQPEDYNPGWFFFGVFVFLVVAGVLLVLSFRKQVRKTDRHFHPDDAGDPDHRGE